MKHLITLGVVITVFSSTFIALPNLIAESRGSLNSLGVAANNDFGSIRNQHQATSLVKFDPSLNAVARTSSKHLDQRGNRRHPFESSPSKLIHRRFMSALVTLSILARGN